MSSQSPPSTSPAPLSLHHLHAQALSPWQGGVSTGDDAHTRGSRQSERPAHSTCQQRDVGGQGTQDAYTLSSSSPRGR